MRNKIQTLSFCITCKNRFNQISKTLKKNLDDNRLFKDIIEFILVDFGSNDGLFEWIGNNFKEDLQSGYLKYYYTNELQYWHASIAKNTSHLLANNDILVNLDCDNYTGRYGGRYVIRQFYNCIFPIVMHQFSGNNMDGSYGRISVEREYFLKINGYDESFEPMAVQDEDLILRLHSYGLKYLSCKDGKYNQAIKNTKEEGLSQTNSSLTYMEMLKKNTEISEKNIGKGQIIANPDGWGIKNNLFDINEKEFFFLNT